MRQAILIALGWLVASVALAQSESRPIDRLYAGCFHGSQDACKELRDVAKTMVRAGQSTGYTPREMLNAECRAGLGSGCVRLRMLETRMRENGSPMPEIATPEKPVAPAPEPTPAAETADAGLPVWVWFVGGMFLGIAGLIGLIWYITNPVPEEPRPITPPLPLPKLRAGDRTAQGDLAKPLTDDQQVVPWDRTAIHSWLDEQIKIARPLVTDETLLSLLNPMEKRAYDTPSGRTTAGEYLLDISLPHAPGAAWEDPRFRLYDLLRARQDIVGGGYALGTGFSNASHDFPAWVPVALYRLDADKDFQPATINMHDHLHARGLLGHDDGLSAPTTEAYLRHHFNIGAPDGYLFLASHLIDFYVAYGQRPDHGYVAAAMRRIKTLDLHDYQRWHSYLERRELPVDLQDQSIDADGLMKTQHEARKLGTH